MNIFLYISIGIQSLCVYFFIRTQLCGKVITKIADLCRYGKIEVDAFRNWEPEYFIFGHQFSFNIDKYINKTFFEGEDK